MRQTVEPILKINNLQTHFFTKAGILRAVDGVSFEIAAGEIVGLVGESGSGKVNNWIFYNRFSGLPWKNNWRQHQFKGEDLNDLSNEQMQHVRGNRIAMIFQDPMMTLNPVLRVETQMIEAIQAHDNKISREDARIRSRDALGLVGISSPDERLRAYPSPIFWRHAPTRFNRNSYVKPPRFDYC
jgi:peptide/nickel transport system ATP-binding protein